MFIKIVIFIRRNLVNMTKLFSICACILLCATAAYGQQDPQFSQYMFNSLYYNPAVAGANGLTTLTAIHRSQYAGYSATLDDGGAPNTQVVSFSTPLLRASSGIGLYIVNDRLGPLNNLEAQVSYAYHLAVAEDAKLSFGVRLGIYSQSVNDDEYRWIDPADPLNVFGGDAQVRPDLALGVHYQANNYRFGVGVNHILETEFDFGNDPTRNPLVRHMYVTGAYDYAINYNLTLTPSFIVKVSDFNSLSFDVNVMGTYKERMWAGISFRQSDAMVGMLGYSFLKDNALKLGYAFDYIIKAQDVKEPTSHEVMLSYTLPVPSVGGRKIIRTPRFRH